MDELQSDAFGSRLRRLRRQAGLTQEELAERAGMSVRGLGDLERGVSQAPYRATVQQLALALQLSPDERATLESAGRRPAKAILRDSLPSRRVIATPSSPLIGRSNEMTRIMTLIGDGDTRLITLTGPGGVGKTRLALEVAARLQGSAMAEIAVVPLASVRLAKLVAPTIARSLGLRAGSEWEAVERIACYIDRRDALFVLDNLEHLPEAVDVVAQLLQSCPGLRVLVTSRAPLHLRDEQEYPIQPLSVPNLRYSPPASALRQYSAVELFVQRATAVQPEFTIGATNAATVAGICVHLDGLPLALELAAARIKMLPPQELLGRLERDGSLRILTGGARDLPDRLQTMRSAVAWSHDLIDPRVQVLFRRLAVFAGGCTLASAEAICSLGGDLDGEVLDGIAELVDQSLLRVEEPTGGEARFALLEPVREYAAERLDGNGEVDAVRARHAEYFLALAESAEEELGGPDQARWLELLQAEHDNIREALASLSEAGEGPSMLRLSAALWQFWRVRAHLSEGGAYLDQALLVEDSDPGLRAKALRGAGVLAHDRGQYERAISLLEESLQLYTQLESEVGIAHVSVALAYICNDQGDYERSATLYTKGLTLFRSVGDRANSARVMSDLACVELNQGRLGAARELYAESLELSRELGDSRAIAIALLNLGALTSQEGQYGNAIELFQASLEIRRTLGDDAGVALVLLDLGEANWLRGEHDQAASLLAESLTLSQRAGNQRVTIFALITLAAFAADRGQARRASHLWGAAQNLCKRTGISVPPGGLARYEAALSAAREWLGDDAWTSACARGGSLTLQEAVGFALDQGSEL
jgi:predicted ATPase/DNA-binding XRE family transcriptional regulator